MRSFYFIIFATAGNCLLSGCAFYVPNMVNAPLFREKNEFRANLNPRNLQAGFAVSDKIAVTVNGNYRNQNAKMNYVDSLGQNSQIHYKNNAYFAEGAAGYFKPLGDKGVFEMFGGAGIGSIDYLLDFPGIQADANGNYYRIFFQPDIGLTTEYVDFAFSTRIASVVFNRFSTTLSAADLATLDLDISENTPYTFVEPALTFRAGWQNFKFHVQAKLGLLVSGGFFYYNPFGFTVGLHFNIADRYRK